MKIDVYSHAIRVTDVITDRDLQAMMSFCRPLVEYGFEKKGKRFVPKGLRTYASATRNRKEFGFHRNQLQDLKRHLFQNHGYVERLVPITYHPVEEIKVEKAEFEIRKMHSPREKQVGIIEYVLDDESPKWDPIIKMVTLQTGGGKALRADSIVMTPYGWKRIDKLMVGNYVMAHDGSFTKVIGVYPQGKLPLFRFTFEDGRTVDACKDHLWKVSFNEGQDEVLTTAEIIERLKDPSQTAAIPLLTQQDREEDLLPVDPFVYGCLLTKGHMGNRVLNIDDLTVLPSIRDEFIASLPLGYTVTAKRGFKGIPYTSIHPIDPEAGNHLHQIIIDEDLIDLPSVREIKVDYLLAAPQQRRRLLKALILSSGTIKDAKKGGYVVFRSISERMLDDVVRLVRSLGGIASVVQVPIWTGKGENRRIYRYNREVKLHLRDINEIMGAEWVTAKQPSTLKLTSIEPVDTDEAVCIAVEHPDKLFVTKDYIVTHNTFVAQYCMNQLGARTIIHFKGGYVQRWKDDLEETFNFKRGEFLIVRGSKDLAALQQMCIDGDLKAKVIIITSATMRDYIKDYEESNGHSTQYPIKPIEFYPRLGVGFRVTDELHQEFHNNYRIDLYTHVPKSLGLSATMVSSDAFKNKVYDIAYPVTQRHDGGGYHVYIGVMAVLYHMDEDVRIRYMGAQGYSHTTFEESIMRHKGLLKNYLKIIDHAIYHRFVSVREEGQSALVFFARVDMCTMMVERLRKMYPELNIVRYVGSENDSYEDFLEADIAVSTIGSAGTAVDKPNLRASFMTTAIDSRQSNEQVLGRTRPLKDWPDVTPEFIYFGCLEIEQHVKYHARKREFFKGKVLSHGEMISRYSISIK